ncbi:unnamed protein product [Protopolystoma xenopodis]|uniref:Beta-catenin-like protein 1 N-terminal domain-containing protein n=1 Tax=Protopolystoma xenopodis TaxID=117903 RepID=A0A3S4ZWG6_9PLAT|nr:unnamed protein product [Protopolystoma xenopodis]
MTNEKHLARDGALRVLDFAMAPSLSSLSSTGSNESETITGLNKAVTEEDQTSAANANCEKFVEILGLRTIFPLFMHGVKARGLKITPSGGNRFEPEKTLPGPTSEEMEEHIIK